MDVGQKKFQENYWSNKKDSLIHEEHEIRAMQLISSNINTKLLDIGCGNGHLLSLYYTNPIRVGVDISEIALLKAKQHGIATHLCDISDLKLPYDEGYFDIITLLDVLEHTLQPIEVLKQAGKYGGTIILSVPNMAFVKDRVLCLLGRIPSELTPKKGHCYYMTKTVIEKLIKDAGFTVFAENHYVVKIPLFRWLLGFWPSLFATMFCYKINKTNI